MRVSCRGRREVMRVSCRGRREAARAARSAAHHAAAAHGGNTRAGPGCAPRRHAEPCTIHGMEAARPRRVLVICTGNSCRSQMAEGWLRHLLGDRLEVASAGTHPAREVSPLAIRVMAEAGVDISGQVPEHVSLYEDEHWDLVVTVCDDAREACPAFPGAARSIHAGFPDPWAVVGTGEERLAAYRGVRDAIRRDLVPLVARHLGLPPPD